MTRGRYTVGGPFGHGTLRRLSTRAFSERVDFGETHIKLRDRDADERLGGWWPVIDPPARADVTFVLLLAHQEDLAGLLADPDSHDRDGRALYDVAVEFTPLTGAERWELPRVVVYLDGPISSAFDQHGGVVWVAVLAGVAECVDGVLARVYG